MKSLIRPLLRPVYVLMRVYWFVFRPHTYGAIAIITNVRNEVLLIRHSYGERLWKLCGGGIKRGEKPAEAMKREIFEELGMTVPLPRLLYQFVSTKEYKHDHVYVFAADGEGQTPQVDNLEVVEAEWFPLSALPSPLSLFAAETLQNFHPT